MESSVKLGRIAGIEIGIHYTWLFAVGLITWSLASGVLPSGLALSAAGVLSGTPTAEGSWQFDLAGYCAARLAAAGVAAAVTPHDTLALEDAFFSHRRRTLSGGGPIGHQLSAIAIGG